MPTSRAASHPMRRALRKAYGSRSRPGWRGCRSRTRPGTRRSRSTISTPQSSGSARRGERSTRRAAIRCSSDAPNAFSLGDPISRRRSAGSRPTREAGADCLYAPGIRTRDQIAAVVAGVAPKPVNLLIGSASELTLQEIAALGVRRVSVGGALARSAWGGFMRAARLIAEQGRFDGFADAASGRELDSFFRDDLKRRTSQ